MLRPNTNSAQYMPGETMAALENLLRQIQTESAIGRVSVIPDPEELRNHPETDIILEPGDTIVVPKRPSTVTVLGEVLQPGTFVWDKNAAATDYIDRAGGLTTFADSSRIIAILPDGTARAVSSSWLSLGLHDDVPVGSTIVVFRDFTSLPTHQLITDVTAIMSQLATSAAALAVLSKY